jgi:bacillithiol synthase
LTNADAVADALSRRNEEIRELGIEPQVHEVSGLTLVFRHNDGVRTRIPVNEVAGVPPDANLSPNVLLRPIVERAILPTVAYVGGPAELAYFAQTVAVSDALNMPAPLAVPRYSGTIVEEHVRRILDRHGLGVADLSSPHEAWNRIARAGVADEVIAAIAALRNQTDASFDLILSGSANGANPLADRPDIVKGAKAGIHHRIARFERRLIAAAKRRDSQLADDIATARGALFPLGRRQERALNIIPLLARHGDFLLSQLSDAAGAHAEALLTGVPSPAGGASIGVVPAGD